VPTVVICPACQSQGSIPDGAAVAPIRCPRCGQTFDVKGATQSSPATTAKANRPPAAPEPRAAKAPVSASGSRRAPSGFALPGVHRSRQSSGPLAYLGIAGLAVVLAVSIVVVVMTQGSGGQPEVIAHANTPPPPEPVVQPAAPRPAVPAAAVAPPASGADSASSQVIDRAEVVRRLTDATVYIKQTLAGKPVGSGSGFVIDVHGDTVFIATNSRIAGVDLSADPGGLLPPESKPELEAVFRSGQGPQHEQSVPAQVAAVDSSDEATTDLAILVAQGVKRPPTPIDLKNKSETTAGMTFQGAGFSRDINDGKGNPLVTIIGGKIAASRRDERGHVHAFQIDGSLHGGNSGGPIVEEKTGKLVGIIAAGVPRTGTIDLLVPAEHLRRMMAGRIGGLDVSLEAIQDKSARLKVKANIVDPKPNVQGVLVYVAPASDGTLSPNGDGTWPPLPNTTPVELERDATRTSATGVVQVAFASERTAQRKIVIQTALRDIAGKLVYSQPRVIDLPAKPGRLLVSSHVLGTLRALERTSIAMLGPLIDPENDCKQDKDDDKLKIKIEIPGGKVRSLAPYVVQRLNKNKPLHNAPMTLVDVAGDFSALVKVTGEMLPGSNLPKDRQGNNIPFTFNGAGLLLYQDKDNFVRLERSAAVDVSSLKAFHTVLFEVVKDGTQVENQIQFPEREGPVYLLLMRRKGRVVVGAGPDLGLPPMPFKGIALELSPKVKIGLSASNISAKPLTAQFENFALLSNETQMDAMFGDEPPPDSGGDKKQE
jgi:Trypsin-like peptidase domain